MRFNSINVTNAVCRTIGFATIFCFSIRLICSTSLGRSLYFSKNSDIDRYEKRKEDKNEVVQRTEG